LPISPTITFEMISQTPAPCTIVEFHFEEW
jgi:hypothetical protein